VTGGSARHGRRNNGLFAAEYAVVGDVDPRVGEHLLDVLGNRGIAAYLQPSADQHPVTRLTTLPGRPVDRLYVDRRELSTAREFYAVATADTAGPIDPDGLGPPALPPPEPTVEFEAAWASIVANFDAPAHDGPRPWPASEDDVRQSDGRGRAIGRVADSSGPDVIEPDAIAPDPTGPGTLRPDATGPDAIGETPAGTESPRTTPSGRHITDPNVIDAGSIDGRSNDGGSNDGGLGDAGLGDAGPTDLVADGPDAADDGSAYAISRHPSRRPDDNPAGGSLLDGLDSFGAELRDDEDEDYHPPAPPPLPRLAGITIVAVLGVIVGIIVIIWPGLLPMSTTGAALLGGTCLVAGGIALIARLRSGDDDEDDPDDGAVV